MDAAQIVTLVGSGVLLLGAILTFLATRGKTQTDAKSAMDARIDKRVDEKLAEAWSQVDDQAKEIEELTGKVKDLGGLLEDAQREIRSLKEDGERRAGAWGRILRSIAAQWPTPQGPDLDPIDIRIVEDTIPPAWVRRRLEGGSSG